MQRLTQDPSVGTSIADLSAAHIRRGSIIGGIVNAVINGAIQFWMLRGQAQIPLTVVGIANDQLTVLGTAVPLAVSPAMILTAIAHWMLKVPKRAFLPDMLWLTFKHGIFAFGLIVSGAVVWQRLMGTVSVSLTTAVLLLAVIAGLVSAMVNEMTIRAGLLQRP